MRKILFKAKSIQTWVYGTPVPNAEEGWVGIIQEKPYDNEGKRHRNYNCDAKTLCEHVYDGIFENDIVEVYAEEPYDNEQFSTDYDWKFTGVVKMIDCMWCVLGDWGISVPFCDIINQDLDYKVLGNKFDNPELLEKI